MEMINKTEGSAEFVISKEEVELIEKDISECLWREVVFYRWIKRRELIGPIPDLEVSLMFSFVEGIYPK